MRAVSYFDGKPEEFTSYTNQRQLAARKLGNQFLCIHGIAIGFGCSACKASGTVLVSKK